MDEYYVSKLMDPEGYHIVHKQNCEKMPELTEVMFPGNFSNMAPAVSKAEKYFELVRECDICARLNVSYN